MDTPSPGEPNQPFQPPTVQQLSLLELRQAQNRLGEPEYSGQIVQVSGTVTAGSGILHTINTTVPFQDEQAGMTVYYIGGLLNVEAGDDIEVTGTLTQYRGLMEISPPGLQVDVLGKGFLPGSILVLPEDFDERGESLESMLVRINGLHWIEPLGNYPSNDSTLIALAPDNDTQVIIRIVNTELYNSYSPINVTFDIVGLVT
jgi:hypothetical protein